MSTTNYIPTPESVELHLSSNPEFTKKYGKAVKALGGRYSECRGDAHRRFVTLPWNDEGRSLANKLVAEFGTGSLLCGKTTLIVRGGETFRRKHVHAWVVVHKVARGSVDPCGVLLGLYEAAFLKAFPEAAFPEPPVVKAPKPLVADLYLNTPVKFHAVLEALQQYIDNGNDADHLADDEELQAKLEAAEAFRDQLDGVLASLANT